MSRTDWDLRDFAHGSRASELGGISTRMTLFLFLLCAMVAAGLWWASVAVIEEVSRAEGRVIPSGKAQGIESLEGGIVSEILVRDGQEVAAGDSLLRIDTTGAGANLGELNAQRNALLARAARLEAEAESLSRPAFERAGLVPTAPIVMREQALFDSRLAAIDSQRAVIAAQIDQREQEITELDRSIIRVGESLVLIEEEIALRTSSGVVPRAQIIPLERDRTAKRQEQDGLESQRDQARGALREARARLAELELNWRQEVSSERADTLNELSVVEEAIKRADDVVRRADLRAPVAGFIADLAVNTVGSVIAPGEEIMRIVPLGETLEVEARVRPEDIAFVRPGLEASIKLTAFDFTIYGSLPGRVVQVAVDSRTDEQSGETYFPVIVETDETQLTHEGQTHEIRPGMVASVDVLTGQRTVLDYLLKPFRKARLEALRER
ncbi:HlyD family type I secretion periplasmic adaptor subunit [Oceanomicrobium pacificus]|uniref:Membrane fusion protein (MFP) family protein n=1 Tax=Oceanomicrobium pacificus TaxID=2692916 RepID=A0A6B0TZ32_9RHOB|nr:HlyD family type I secretion periplasmic adaptor subunit [Oceanomicrobium pacificus]MXU66668.1 HlyD family type I secretion periplasmic adaptor subunit [Oceanomicrobium pacificus]